jgi:very-short-patch-repair endonuclease
MMTSDVSWDKLDTNQRKKFVEELYMGGESLSQIANMLTTTISTIRRFAIKNGIKLRDRSQAQKQALSLGRAKHPTEGIKRDDATKEKISQSKAKNWAGLSTEEKKKFSDGAKDRWDKMTDAERANLSHAAARAIRETVTTGSKLENFIRGELTKYNFRVVFHTDHMLVNQKLQLDILLPEINTVIEVDGPSHILPIWGEEALRKTQKADEEKNALLIMNGFVVIRVRQTQKHISQSYMQSVANKVIEKVLKIKDKFPSKTSRLIEI